MTVQRSHHGFSLVELAMVVAIMGVVAMIAAPRMSSAATTAGRSAMRANLRVLQDAADAYAAEHGDLCVARELDGTVSDESVFLKRLVSYSDELGNVGTGIYGPYLLRIPRNPVNKLDTVRIDGAPPGSGTAGWLYDTTRNRFYPDHTNARLAAMAESDAVLGDSRLKAGPVNVEAEALGK